MIRNPRWRPPDAKSCFQLSSVFQLRFFFFFQRRISKASRDDYDTYLAKAVHHMYEVRIDQPRQVERKDRGERNRVRISRVEDAESIDFIAYEMDLVLLAELEELLQRLWWVAAACDVISLAIKKVDKHFPDTYMRIIIRIISSRQTHQQDYSDSQPAPPGSSCPSPPHPSMRPHIFQ